MAKIVLAHGILGFGSVLPTDPLQYFNGIKRLYEEEHYLVLCPTVAALGSIAARSQQLQAAIQAEWGNSDDPIFLLAHSMGGLDCRHMLQNNSAIARRVRRLITVATPHYGSPVADAVLHPLFPLLPNPLQGLTSLFSDDAGALADLHTRETLQADDIPTVEYLCVGCDLAETHPKSPVFALTATIGEFNSGANDGVVSLASASKNKHPASLFETWPVDHGGAIGWPSGGIGTEAGQALLSPPADHIARYKKLLATLIR